MGKYLIGIDNGGTMSKAALYDLSGKEIAVSGYKTKTIMPKPGFTERDMEEMWQANVKSIRDVIEISKVDPKDIAGIATTGHGNGMYLVDKDGNPAYNGIISTDTRAKDYVEKWYSDTTFEKVLLKTMQSIWAGQPVPLLAWFKDNNPEVLKKTKWIFMCKDYIRYRLTNEAYAEITDMSGTNLMNVKDVKYDEKLLSEFGIEEIMDKLPPLKYSSEICGYITSEAAKETGLMEGTPVAGGLFDIDASAIATGLTEEEKLCMVAGTWSINEYISKEPVISKDLFMTSIYCMKGYWLTTEASPTSASNLEWFVTEFMNNNTNAYDEANKLVSSISPEESNIVFLPFLYGTNVDANAKASFIGLNGWHTKAHLLRAIYEGVAFCHRAHIDKLLKHREKPKAIRIAGGAAKSEVWVQIFADVLQIPIEVTTSTELGALGAAICAGIATENFESYESAANSMVNVAYTCYPNENNSKIYDKKYNLYKKSIEVLSPLWEELSE
ncbi:FGGY-family carbohydrate kinase [Anaerosalibacter massiliensis]|uniref:Carbohydrate kinase n=1 Tax=Anaerosalibacter massiliensis TaxID=1347392 RepID=A0A9X2MIX1_9FIRM|nr:FGGY-family carbohydrate kinase [Anaerosalibacter massiliensis]MCR2044494.1 carbohydrate kinase [Anaerosalibacter massiliensis]